MDDFSDILLQIDDSLYAFVVVGLLLICGIYFTFRTKFIQIRLIPDMFKYVKDKKVTKGKKTMSSFQALMVSTGSRVGTGNIAGIATAIIMGGPGAVFWMWILAIIGASSAFAESTLAQLFKKKNDDGSFRGGPAYYIEQGLKNRWLGIVFSISLIFTFAIGFNALQAFNAISTLDYYFEPFGFNIDIVHIIAGLVLMILTAAIIFGGMKSIGNVSSVIVPIMALLYIFIALLTIFTNLGCMGEVFSVIFENAFSVQSILAGTAGAALLYGTKRGLLSNEAGMGSAPNAAASASVTHPVKQGLIQSLSAYIDTFLICTSSAFMVMLFCVQSPDIAYSLNGMPLVQKAITTTIGDFGTHFMTVAIFFFAFSSIIGNYSYAESNFSFITKNNEALFCFRVFCLLPIVFGALSSLDIAWCTADIFMAIMAVINIISIILLSKWVIKLLKDYENQKKQGLEPVFCIDEYQDFPDVECWHVGRQEALKQ